MGTRDGEIMRESKRTYNSQKKVFHSRAHRFVKVVVVALLFSLLFSNVLLSANGLNFVFAAAGVQADVRQATAQTVSSVTVGGTNFAQPFNNNHNATYAGYFGVSSEVSNGVSAFGWNSAEDGWGYTDWSSSDNASVWWIEFKFTSTALAAVKAGQVSYYASASCNFSDGTNDESAMAVSFVGVQSQPHVNFISSSRSGSNASWSTTGNSGTAARTEWSDTYVRSMSLGSSGGYSASYKIPTNATGIRFIFAAIADGAMDGGFTALNLSLYLQPQGSISSTNSTFSLVNGLYGDEYGIQATSTDNWGACNKTSAGAEALVVDKIAFAKNTNIRTDKYSGLSVNFGTLSFDTAGIFAGLGNAEGAEMNYYTDMKITLPKGVTNIDFSAKLFAASYVGTAETTDWATVSVQLLKDNNTSITNGTSSLALGSQTGGTNHTQTKNVNLKNLVVNSSASTGNTTVTVRLRLEAGHPNYTGNWVGWGSGDDRGNAYGLIGDIKIKMYGAYTVAYNKGDTGATGTMANQTLRYGIKDVTETLRKNTFVNGSETFVGWATMEGGPVVYKENYTYSGSTVTTTTHDTSSGATGTTGSQYTNWSNELTKVPGATVTLYAVWVDSDFGIIDGKSRDATWGSEDNPFVIENKVHWNNFTDIVNKSREPVDSVKGNHYGKIINTAASYTSFSGNYFALTNNLSLGETDPVGADTVTTASTAKNFKGTLYGANGVYSSGVLTAINGKALKTVTVSIDVASGNAGLFNYLNGANIEYIGVGGQILNTTGSDYAGGIVGLIGGTTAIRNCKSTANVILATFDSANNATAKNGAGGIIGYVQSGANITVENCTYAGGSNYVARNVDGNVVIDANIFGANGVGGIIGYMPGGTTSLKVSGCAASGDICGTLNVGGIIGRAHTTSAAVNAMLLSNLYSSATIKATGTTSTAGGIVGYLYYSGGTTTNNTVKLQYAYNCGSVQGAGSNAGGIVGSAQGANSSNVQIAYCYNTGAVSGNVNVGSINGTGTNTVLNSWSFYAQNAATADFSNLLTGGKGNHAIIAISTTAGAAYYTRPSDADNNTGYSWTDITDTSVEFTKFMVFAASNTFSNGQYAVLRDADRNALVMPDATNNRLTSAAGTTSGVYGQHMVFDAALKNASNQSVSKLAIEKESIKLSSSLARSIIYGNTAPTVGSWITVGATDSNRYATSAKVEYYNGVWADSADVKNVYVASGAVQAYKVRMLLYNGTHLVGVSVPNAATYTINQRQLTVTTGWNNQQAASYVYNGLAQGLKTVTLAGFAANETVASEFNISVNNVTHTINEGSVASLNHTAVITLDDTVAANEYYFGLEKKTDNYKLRVDNSNVDIAQMSVSWAWSITRKSIANPNQFDIDEYDIWFGFGPGAILYGAYSYNIGSGNVFALDMRKLGVFYSAGDAPYALVYKDSSNIYKDISNYNLYLKLADGYANLLLDTDYTVEITSGGSMLGSSITFDGGKAVEVALTFKGAGNYDGTRVIRFTLMESDFGGNVAAANYGSADNPYLIENSAHLVRLGQIVSGNPAWNSINSTDTDIALVPNANAVATSRDYFGAYFRLADNVTVSTASGFISIGKNAENYFSGTFDGEYAGAKHTVTLGVNEADHTENEYGWAISDFTGLFGYLINANIRNITVDGSVAGRDRVGGIAGYANMNTLFEGSIVNNASVTGRSFVGGIVGEFTGAIADAVNGESATVAGTRAVGGIVGGVDSVNKTAITSCENRGVVKYKAFENDTQSLRGFSVTDRSATVHINGIGGIAGYIGASGVRIIDCKNYERANEYRVDGSGANGVGGIVGFASVSDGGVSIEATVDAGTENRGYVRGASFVGGIIGYANNVTIEADCRVNSNVTGDVAYTGGIAGKWIVNDTSQMPGQRRVQSNVYIVGESYVGGLVGWLDAKNTKGFTVNPFITNGTQNPIRVTGTSYVGALYGGVEGYGYKRNSQNASADDSRVYINPSTTGEGIYVRVNLKSGGHVAGGLIGYASGVGILFLGDWTGLDHTPVSFEGTTSFFGGIIGVLGENATIESAMNTSNGVSVGGVTHTLRFRSTQSAFDIEVNGDIVGSIAGYIASSAGTFLAQDTNIMGNTVKLFNNSQIKGRSFVGGIFGAIGKVASEHYVVTNGVNENIFADDYLINLIRYGSYGAQATGPNTTLRYAPSDDGGLGKVFNYSPITASGDFAGGIVGYAGANTLLAFFNPVVSGSESNFSLNDAASYLNVYNGYGNNPTAGDTATIKGANFVGGIAGYLSSSAHEMTRVVSLMLIKANSRGNETTFAYDGSYAGGLFGYMGGGSIQSSIATSGYSNPSASVNAFMGGEYVGGIVGMLAGGTINLSVSRGFRFDSVNMTRGGIAGSANAGTTISSSWTFYLSANPTYSTVSQNKNGNYVIVNGEVASGHSPSFSEYGRMIGLFADTVDIIERASDKVYNPAKAGYLSLSTSLPKVNNQIAFYDASGYDTTTSNEFETLSSANSVVYYRFDMAATDSFSICVLPITFENISSNPSGEAQEKQFVHDAYVRPAASAFYDVDVQSTVYSGGYIQYAQGIAICVGKNNPNDKNNIVVLGNFEKRFEIGDAETPYVISNQTEWNTFARNIRENRYVGGVPVNGYLGKYIKLATDSVVLNLDNLAGDRTSNYNTFKGTFDGDGHKLTINVSSTDAAALSGVSAFPNAAGATFKNLTIEGNITAAGEAFNSTSAENIAGFVGKPLGNLTFENCTNLANITANRTAGGMVGFSNNHTMKFVACVNGRRGANLGNIECNDADIAGYAEYGYGTGGIIGYSNNAITIESCKNEGNIRGAYNVGGIIGRANKGTTIYNCANNGEIFADARWADESEYAGKKDTEAYRKVYVGGIIGQVGEEGWLNMYASYNSGRVVGFGPIVGGLAGSVGSLILASSTSSDTGKAGAKSTIAYCYNTGEVSSSGTSTTYNHRSSGWSGGREEFNGSVVGGIVGFMAWGDINYCYNTGKISTYRIIGYSMSWQARIGGIAGQVQPSASSYSTSFNYCYNLGELFVSAKTENIVGVSSTRIYWGGGICGYLDKNTDTSKLSSTNSYTIANYLHTYCSSSDQSWGSASINTVDGGDEKRYVIGTVVDSVDMLTSYMTSSGTPKVDRSIGTAADISDYYQASTLITSSGKSVATYSDGKMTYNSAFLSGTAYGYIYPYGCLPQLAVFALDTKEGLSMLSVSYGRNDYGKFVGNQAGSKESPYVIKDGVGLLAMSALNGAKSNTGGGTGYYSFKDEYIEFADGLNNIEGLKANYINMDMTTSSYSLKSNSSGSTVYGQSGKNYYLYSLGAASGNTTIRYGSSPATAAALRTNWYNKNYYFNGSSYVNGASYNTYVNNYPIGSVSVPFAGNINGAQGASGNTEIRNLKISVRQSTNAFAGLFGTVYDASVAHITVTGKVSAYTSANTASSRSFAGGIAGYVGGDSKIEACQAGGSSATLIVTAYADTSAQTAPSVEGYAGGIAGAAGPSKPTSRTQDLKVLELSNNRVSNAQINTIRRNAGGIIGYVGNPWKLSGATTGRGNYVNVYDSYVYGATISALATSTVSTSGVDIGGLAGANDGDVFFTVSGANIGVKHPDATAPATGTVNIYGENSIGGVIGTAYGNTAIGGVRVSANTNIARKGYGTLISNADGGLYRTAIGGVIGRTVSETVNTLRDEIVYDGSITVNVATSNPSDNNPTGNVGGVIGAMGEGTRFLSGSIVTVTGSIGCNLTGNYVRNFGGVVGATIEGAFDGTFTVSPKISADNATNVGGFIGRNFGTANILSSTNGTVIKIEANITGKSQVGGLVGLNGYTYADGVVAGSLLIGADTYLGGRYEGTVDIEISGNAHIKAFEDDAGGLIGSNTANGAGLGLIITKGSIYNKGTVVGLNNVGGIVGNNEGGITMGGSTLLDVIPRLVNEGNVTGGNFGANGYADDGNGKNVGGVIGYLQKGSIAGTFANTGSVEGGYFVGGSIGRLDKEASLTVSGSNNTYFYNGLDDIRNADTASRQNGIGNVSGKRYVGGSIGAMFGTVNGTSANNVVFVNDGIVNGDTFTGGNIGLLAGGVNGAQFINRGRILASGAVAVGGSVGMIGISGEYDGNTYEHQPISVSNAHFEFVADLSDGGDKNSIIVSGSAPAGKDEFHWGGVGGAIGVIGSAEDGFDNVNGSLWQSVTLYAEGSINAANVNNVGGAIGLIKANNIVISNMLAFYTSVTGKKNVGGIVGAVTGRNIEINNSFNIEGTVSGDTAGGIVGWVVKDGEGVTVADTSYWVKGYLNAQLMALDLASVVDDIGKYVAVSDSVNVFTEELTNAYETPAHYTGKPSDGTDWAVYLKKLCGHDVRIVNGVWAYEQNSDGYTTGEASTGWYYIYANDRRGLDATHVNAQDSSKPSVLAEGERAAELAYWKRIANAYTAEERVPDENGIIEATKPLNSPIVGQVNGNNVSGNGALSVGSIYAAALESKINGYYLYMDASGEKPSIYYSSDTVDWNGTGVQERPFYLTAKTSLDKSNPDDRNAQNVVVYYRSVGIGGTLTYNGYKRYVPITAEIGKTAESAQTKVIKYLSGDDLLSEGKSGDYVYTMTNVKKDGVAIDQNSVCEAGNYTTDVSIYFYDALGNYGKIGGIDEGLLRIEKLVLESTISASNGTYQGDNTDGSIRLTLNGIAPLDNGRNMLAGAERSVKFNISGEVTGQISGILDIGALMRDAGPNGIGSKTFTPDDRLTSQALVNLSTSKIYMSSYSIAYTTDLRNIDWDTDCIADDAYTDGVKPFTIAIEFRFNETISDKFIAELSSSGISANYNTNPVPLSADFNIKPALLELKISDGAKFECEYDGATHNTQYQFVGWVENAVENKSALINSLKPYVQYNSLAEESANQTFGGPSALWDLMATDNFVLTGAGKTYVTARWINGITAINLSGMKEKGNYYVKFAAEATYEYDGVKYMLTEGGNYYVKVPMDAPQHPTEQKPLYRITPNAFTMSWATTGNSATYNAGFHYLTASFTARFAFGSAELIEQEIATVLPESYEDGEYIIERVDNQHVRIKFRVGPNAGRHTVKLPSQSTYNCVINDITDGTFTINKLGITVSFKGDKVVVYNGTNHQAETIEVGCATDENANPQFSFSANTGLYTISMFGDYAGIANTEDENKVNIALLYKNTATGAEVQYAVNAGVYTAKVGAIRSVVSGVDNFEVTATAAGSLTINRARITLNWGVSSSFVYNGNPQGRGLTASVSASGLTQSSFNYDPGSTASALLNIRNAYSRTETFTIPVTGNAQTNARSTAYNASVNVADIRVSGQNRAGATVIDNYDISFSQAANGKYTITPFIIKVTGMSGSTYTKTYDATVNVSSASIGSPIFENTSLKPSASSITVTAVYDSANVGTNRTITYTITIKTGTSDANNFEFENGTNKIEYRHNGTIRARELTVTLDILRNMHAVKMYNGNAWYGGMAGAVSVAGSGTAVSAIHRFGEGFTVSGIAAAESAGGAVMIHAMFREATDGRSDFDAYVNNVIGTGANLSIADTVYGDEDYFYKNLVFVLSGTSSANYTFKVVRTGNTVVGDKTGSAGDSGAVTVSGKTSDIYIEITPVTTRAYYGNIAQSYATADNTYNTNWLDVTGRVNSVNGDMLSVKIVNNWQYVNNNPANGVREYHSYTVIRGGENSNILSAKVDSNTGVHVNYRLGNQPVLTIGYFVDKEEFEVGSIAGLMIASYYFTASKNGGGDFGIISQAVWVPLATEQQYFDNVGYPTDNNGQPFLDADGNAITITCWDDYFNWLASDAGGNRDVFLNSSDEDTGWGYYTSDASSTPKSFDKFKQVANISGVFTDTDIAILNGMFKKTVVGADGTVNEDASYDWGVGSKYLTNFLKLSAGSVATAMGSLFEDTFDGTYDGNGYVIDGLNIAGVASGESYIGMFERIASNANVKNVHLRNINITVGGAGTAYVGGLAGESAQTVVENVSVHGTINVNVSGTAYVGGLFGAATSKVDGAIALGDMTVKATTANAGGAIGKATGENVNNVVSLMQMWIIASTANAGGILGATSTATLGGVNEFMKDSVWANRTQIAGGKTYTELYNGSVSGYGASKYYYTGDAANASGIYDVLDDVRLTKMDGEANSKTKPRESMRLADIISVYVLMYAKTAAAVSVDGVSVDVFGLSAKSWLVGSAHGTDNSGDAIVIANQQGIALLRELRFATFTLKQDVHMYSTYVLQTASGAFYGKVISGGHSIYISTWNGTQKLFEIETGTATPTAVLKKA